MALASSAETTSSEPSDFGQLSEAARDADLVVDDCAFEPPSVAQDSKRAAVVRADPRRRLPNGASRSIGMKRTALDDCPPDGVVLHHVPAPVLAQHGNAVSHADTAACRVDVIHLTVLSDVQPPSIFQLDPTRGLWTGGKRRAEGCNEQPERRMPPHMNLAIVVGGSIRLGAKWVPSVLEWNTLRHSYTLTKLKIGQPKRALHGIQGERGTESANAHRRGAFHDRGPKTVLPPKQRQLAKPAL